VSPEAPLVALLSKFIEHPGSTLFVTDDDSHLLGIVTSDDITSLIRDAASLETLVIAEDILTAQDFPTVSADDSLAQVMKFLGSYKGEVAVLERGRLVGVIWPQDVIQRYNTEIFKRDMARSMVSVVNGESAVVTAVEDTAVAEIPVPAQFVGRSIRDLDIRKNFGVSVLMVKQSTADGQEKLQTTPSADYIFRQDDVMLVMGPNEELRRLKRGR
jgi:trk system potassium uptake protein TrkA